MIQSENFKCFCDAYAHGFKINNSKNLSEKNKTKQQQQQTSMMWPSQNFLLYNGTVIKIEVNEWINN